MANGFLNISWAIWGILALGISLVFTFFVPAAEQVNATSGLQFIIVRWFHSLCWLLLAVNFFLRALKPRLTGLANIVAATGGVIYLIFIINFLATTAG